MSLATRENGSQKTDQSKFGAIGRFSLQLADIRRVVVFGRESGIGRLGPFGPFNMNRTENEQES
jgi:hypothetical protein